MDNKLQNIKDEVAKGLGYPHWNELLHWEAHNHYLGLTLEKAIDQVAIRYAQEQNRELVEMLEMVVMDLEERGRAYGDIYEMCKNLITKHKQS